MASITNRIRNSLPAHVVGAAFMVAGWVSGMHNLIDLGAGMMIGGLVTAPESKRAANKPA